MVKLMKLFNAFFNNEKSGGITIILCTIFSLVLANSSSGDLYHHFWKLNLLGNNLEYWINDGLMTIFFLLIGLELKREVYLGELSNIKKALLPFFGAIGGMIAPAIIFILFNHGTVTKTGAGIPMATDIAFALGVLSLLGKNIPASLKIFLAAFAVIDDLGAILIIAFFYTKNLVIGNLLLSLGIFGLLMILNKLKIKNIAIYLLGGGFMWYFMLNSGVHATITGVLLAIALPFENGNKNSISFKIQHFLHKPVAFLILPLFALANTSLVVSGDFKEIIVQEYSQGVFFGLVLGKPIGIFIVSFVAVSFGICKLPDELNWKLIFGAGILGGIGFTMSIFITLLAYDNQLIINNTKLTILISSSVAALIGYIYLKIQLKKI